MVRVRAADIDRLMRPQRSRVSPRTDVSSPAVAPPVPNDPVNTVGIVPPEDRIVLSLSGLLPAPKERHRMGPRGAYTTHGTSAYELLVAEEGRRIMAGRPPMGGPLSCRLVFGFPIPVSWPAHAKQEALDGIRVPVRRADWDNLAKAVIDGLNKVVYMDDAQIVEASIQKVYAAVPFVYAEFFARPGLKAGWRSSFSPTP